MNRFKTKEEFEKEFGKDWRGKIPFGWYERMDVLLGKETKTGVGDYTSGQEGGLDSIHVSSEMLTSKELKSKTEVNLLEKIEVLKKTVAKLVKDAEDSSIQRRLKDLSKFVVTLMDKKECFHAIEDLKKVFDRDIKELKDSIPIYTPTYVPSEAPKTDLHKPKQNNSILPNSNNNPKILL
jgi:hypothetical protein